MNAKHILNRIEQRMEELGMSQADLSRASGRRDVVKNMRAKVSKGQPYSLTVPTLDDLARALKTTPEWLSRGAIKPTPRAAPSEAAPDLDYIFALVAGSYQALVPELPPVAATELAAFVRQLSSKPVADFGSQNPDLEARILAAVEVRQFLKSRKPQ